jgi:hypothetical protein
VSVFVALLAAPSVTPIFVRGALIAVLLNTALGLI